MSLAAETPTSLSEHERYAKCAMGNIVCLEQRKIRRASKRVRQIKACPPVRAVLAPLCRRRAAAEGNDMLDVAVIGCGIVGANVAYLLSQHKLRAAVFEKENDVSMGTTRANSAIVHAGYDPEPGTAMARLNVRGSALTKEQCAAFDVKYRQIGSLGAGFFR